MNDMTVPSPIGQAMVRREDQRFITGAGQYTDDVVLPRQTHGVFVRSPHLPLRSTDCTCGTRCGAISRFFQPQSYSSIAFMRSRSPSGLCMSGSSTST